VSKEKRFSTRPYAGRLQSALRHTRRNFLSWAGCVALAGAALWHAPSLAALPEDSLVLNASFPKESGPGRFLTALCEQMSSGGGPKVSWQQRAPSDMPGLAEAPEGFFVLSNQELFPTQGEAVESPLASLLRPVAPLLVNPYFVVVPSKSRIKSVDELIDQARSNPGTVRYGSWGASSLGDKYAAAMAQATNTRMQHVVYRDLPSLYEAMGKGKVEWSFGTSIGPAAAAHRQGLIRYLAVADSVRDPEHDVPTMAESGGPAYLYFGAWLGLYAGRQVQDALVDQVRERIAAAARSTALREKYPSMPGTADMTAQRLSEHMRREPRAPQRDKQ